MNQILCPKPVMHLTATNSQNLRTTFNRRNGKTNAAIPKLIGYSSNRLHLTSSPLDV